jgi:hypothetical protein
VIDKGLVPTFRRSVFTHGVTESVVFPDGFDVPKLYMADFTFGDSPLNVKKLPYAIIDGKQRLEGIFDFFEGEIGLNDDFVLLEDPTTPLGGLTYAELQNRFPDLAERFEEYELSVMSVITKKEDLVNELFIRLNRSKPLRGAEIRNAMKGPAPEVIRQIAKHEFFTSYIRFDTQRGEDLNVVAKLLSFEYHGKPQPTKKADLDGFVSLEDLSRCSCSQDATHSIRSAEALGPSPIIGSLSPSTVTFAEVQQGFLLTVNGSHFVSSSVVVVNGTTLSTLPQAASSCRPRSRPP